MQILKKIVGAAPLGPKFQLGPVGPRWAPSKNVTWVFCLGNYALSNDVHIAGFCRCYRPEIVENVYLCPEGILPGPYI